MLKLLEHGYDKALAALFDPRELVIAHRKRIPLPLLSIIDFARVPCCCCFRVGLRIRKRLCLCEESMVEYLKAERCSCLPMLDRFCLQRQHLKASHLCPVAKTRPRSVIAVMSR